MAYYYIITAISDYYLLGEISIQSVLAEKWINIK